MAERVAGVEVAAGIVEVATSVVEAGWHRGTHERRGRDGAEAEIGAERWRGRGGESHRRQGGMCAFEHLENFRNRAGLI